MRVILPILLLCATTTAIAQQDIGPTKTVAYVAPKTGEFWYGMYRPDGGRNGYAHLKVSKTMQGGVHFEFKVVVNEIEFANAATFDSDWRQTFVERRSGDFRLVAAREGGVMVGKNGVDDLRVEVSADAVAGANFVLVACAPFVNDFEFTRAGYNDTYGLRTTGPITYRVGATESVELPDGAQDARRVTIQRQERGREQVVWVNNKREIVQVDWGDKVFMKLHRGNVEALLEPTQPFMRELEPENAERLVLTADFHGFELKEMWEHWLTVDGLKKWWAPEAEIEPKADGKYVLSWRDDDGRLILQLNARIKELEPHSRLNLAWHWSVTYDAEYRRLEDQDVVIEFSEIKGGVAIKITHGPFESDDVGGQHRDSIKQGWVHFCTQLAGLKK